MSDGPDYFSKTQDSLLWTALPRKAVLTPPYQSIKGAPMSTLLFVLLSLSSSLALASNEFFCEQVHNSQASHLRVIYEDKIPVEVALKDPALDEDWRPQDVVIQVVTKMKDNGRDSFQTRPAIEPEDINWDMADDCFVVIGDRWYFQFDRDLKRYFVTIHPNFIVQTPSCIPPRVPPQSHELNCGETAPSL
jgi:hypothetical protein